MGTFNQILAQSTKYLIENRNFTDDIGMAYGKGGVCLFLFLYSQNVASSHKKVANELLGEILETFSADVSRYFIHTASIGSFVHYLRRNDMIRPAFFDDFEEIDLFLLDVINEDDSSLIQCDLFTTLNYLSSRYRDVSLSKSKRMKFELAIEHIIVKMDEKFNALLVQDKFWNLNEPLLYYEYPFNFHNYFNYIELTLKYTTINSNNASVVITKVIEKAYNALKIKLFLDNEINHRPAVLPFKYILRGLQCLGLFESFDKTSCLIQSQSLLYKYVKKKFGSNKDRFSKNELLTIFQIMRKLSVIKRFDFNEEIKLLSSRLCKLIDTDKFGGVNSSVGLVDMGMVNGLAGISIALLAKEFDFDEEWDSFILIY